MVEIKLTFEELGYIIGNLMVISLAPQVKKEDKEKNNLLLEKIKGYIPSVKVD